MSLPPPAPDSRVPIIPPEATERASAPAPRLRSPSVDEIIEACAVAAEAQDRVGCEWVRDSLWDAVLSRAGANVRALKGTLERPALAPDEAPP